MAIIEANSWKYVKMETRQLTISFFGTIELKSANLAAELIPVFLAA